MPSPNSAPLEASALANKLARLKPDSEIRYLLGLAFSNVDLRPLAEGWLHKIIPSAGKRFLGELACQFSSDSARLVGARAGGLRLELHTAKKRIKRKGDFKIAKGQTYASIHLTRIHGQPGVKRAPQIRPALRQLANFVRDTAPESRPVSIVGVSYERLTRVAAMRYGFGHSAIAWGDLTPYVAHELAETIEGNQQSADSTNTPKRSRLSSPGQALGMIHMPSNEFIERFADTASESDDSISRALDELEQLNDSL